MSAEPRPTRVRVTGPPRRGGVRSRSDAGDDGALGEVYVTSLLREQAWLAVRVLLVLAVAVGGLPLLFVLAPDLAAVDVLGLPLAWLVLGVLVYPLLVLLGWRYVRRAERNERDFAALLTRDDP